MFRYLYSKINILSKKMIIWHCKMFFIRSVCKLFYKYLMHFPPGNGYQTALHLCPSTNTPRVDLAQRRTYQPSVECSPA